MFQSPNVRTWLPHEKHGEKHTLKPKRADPELRTYVVKAAEQQYAFNQAVAHFFMLTVGGSCAAAVECP